MPRITDNNGSALNSEYSIDEIDGVFGLILESWGPSSRNPQYNAAFDVILERLINLGVPYIEVYVISAKLIKTFPNIQDRKILVNDNKIIKLNGRDIKMLRLQIGREQANLKAGPSSTGGNRTKRIIIHIPKITSNFWTEIAQGNASRDKYYSLISGSTYDYADLEEKVKLLHFIEISKPKGNSTPNKTTQNTQSYARDPEVKAWVLKQANGSCEVCDSPAPFFKTNDIPYLEVHHILPLSDGGSDTVTNTVAVCPNCHMQFHYGKDSMVMRDEVKNKIDRIIREDSN